MLDKKSAYKTGALLYVVNDILEKKKQHSRMKGVPIFVFANTDKQEYSDQAEKLGADRYIIKANTTPQEMVERIKKFVEDRLAA